MASPNESLTFAKPRTASPRDPRSGPARARGGRDPWLVHGLEAIFERIARELDMSVPSSDRWHRELLTQMTAEIPSVRPSVIDSSVLSDLVLILAFRHFFRHAYAVAFDPERLATEVKRVLSIEPTIRDALDGFVAFLKEAMHRVRGTDTLRGAVFENGAPSESDEPSEGDDGAVAIAIWATAVTFVLPGCAEADDAAPIDSGVDAEPRSDHHAPEPDAAPNATRVVDLARALPDARQETAVVTLDGKVYVLGGLSADAASSPPSSATIPRATPGRRSRPCRRPCITPTPRSWTTRSTSSAPSAAAPSSRRASRTSTIPTTTRGPPGRACPRGPSEAPR